MVEKRWGGYEILCEGIGYQVKKIWLNPYESMSLQRHKYRREHWFFVEGSGLMLANGAIYSINAGDNVDVQYNSLHTITTNEEGVVAIETWYGSYLSEDDIERFK